MHQLVSRRLTVPKTGTSADYENRQFLALSRRGLGGLDRDYSGARQLIIYLLAQGKPFERLYSPILGDGRAIRSTSSSRLGCILSASRRASRRASPCGPASAYWWF